MPGSNFICIIVNYNYKEKYWDHIDLKRTVLLYFTVFSSLQSQIVPSTKENKQANDGAGQKDIDGEAGY